MSMGKWVENKYEMYACPKSNNNDDDKNNNNKIDRWPS